MMKTHSVFRKFHWKGKGETSGGLLFMYSGLGIGGSWFQDPLNRGCSSPCYKMADDSQPFCILGRGTVNMEGRLYAIL